MENQELLAVVVAVFMGGLITPLLNWVKGMSWFKAIPVTPDFLSILLSFAVIFGLARGLGIMPEASTETLVMLALGMDKTSNFAANRWKNYKKGNTQ
jgi:hypothetical protein